MKLIHFFIGVSLIITIVACNKEETQEDITLQESVASQAPDLPEEFLKEQDFPYKQEVKIKAPEGDHYVRYSVASHNEEAMKAMVNDLQNSSLILLDKDQEPELNKQEPAHQNPKPTENVQFDLERAVHLKELERSIGSHLGYEMSMSNQTPRNQILQSSSTITLTTGFASGIVITNLWVNPCFTYHYFSDGTPGWVFDQLRTQLPGTQFTFTGGGFTTRYFVIQPSSASGTRIHWRVWPEF